MAEAASGPWNEDLNEVFRAKYGLVPDAAGVVSWPYEDVRALMTDAWQFGYTTGMKDSATFEERLTQLDEALDSLRDHVLPEDAPNRQETS